jgi:spore coat protein U-like protein
MTDENVLIMAIVQNCQHPSSGETMAAKSHLLQRYRTIGCAIGFACSAANPAYAGSATASATAVVVAPVAISNGGNLSFGSFDATTPGTITVNTAGVRTASGVKLSGGSPSAASFTVTGQPGLGYTISYAGTSGALTNGTESLGFSIVSDVGGAPTAGGTPVTSAVLGSGATTLRVGGVLTVGAAGAPPGAYTGTIAVAVQYQ